MTQRKVKGRGKILSRLSLKAHMKQGTYGNSSTQQFSDLFVMPKPNPSSKSIFCNGLPNVAGTEIEVCLNRIRV